MIAPTAWLRLGWGFRDHSQRFLVLRPRRRAIRHRASYAGSPQASIRTPPALYSCYGTKFLGCLALRAHPLDPLLALASEGECAGIVFNILGYNSRFMASRCNLLPCDRPRIHKRLAPSPNTPLQSESTNDPQYGNLLSISIACGQLKEIGVRKAGACWIPPYTGSIGWHITNTS